MALFSCFCVESCLYQVYTDYRKKSSLYNFIPLLLTKLPESHLLQQTHTSRDKTTGSTAMAQTTEWLTVVQIARELGVHPKQSANIYETVYSMLYSYNGPIASAAWTTRTFCSAARPGGGRVSAVHGGHCAPLLSARSHLSPPSAHMVSRRRDGQLSRLRCHGPAACRGVTQPTCQAFRCHGIPVSSRREREKEHNGSIRGALCPTHVPLDTFLARRV